jgi:hypothetical protein
MRRIYYLSNFFNSRLAEVSADPDNTDSEEEEEDEVEEDEDSNYYDNN